MAEPRYDPRQILRSDTIAEMLWSQGFLKLCFVAETLYFERAIEKETCDMLVQIAYDFKNALEALEIARERLGEGDSPCQDSTK